MHFVTDETTSTEDHPDNVYPSVPSGTDQVDILMYHSISNLKGPTTIDPDTFRMQMDELAASARPVVPLNRIAAWHRGEVALPPDAVALTFDDGFVDFAKNAFPVLFKKSWPATVFLPTAKIGGTEDWNKGAGRRLLDWSMVKALSQGGIDFGGHGATHRDLTRLTDGELEQEVRGSYEDLSDMLERAPSAFAQPYGRSSPKVCLVIGQYYDMAVGTPFAKAGQSDNLFELPRIEMHYFRKQENWRDYLNGRGAAYFKMRKTLRSLRRMVTGG